MDRPTLIGQTLSGRYKVEELLGQGGMSAVYKASDPNLKRTVAIKTIHNHLAGDPRFQARFESEATAVAALRHSNIVQVYDFSHDGELYYMVQEFVPGETLQDRLRRLNETHRSMPVAEALRTAIQIADAAGYAHRRGMIHRDIKPANIMLDVHGQAILMDFGIVKITGSAEHTVTGAVVGTAVYMPPELIRGEVPDPRSDIYSLGVTLFEMISGHPPFEANSAMTLLMMHLHDPVPDLRAVRPDVPAPLVDIVRQALAKDRQERFASMEALSGVLRNLLAHLETGAPLLHVQPTELVSAGDREPVSEATVLDTPQQQRTPILGAGARKPIPSSRPSSVAAVPPSSGRAAVQDTARPAAASPGPAGQAARPSALPTAPLPRKGRRGLLAGGAVLLLALLLGLGFLLLNQDGGGGDEQPETGAGAESTVAAQGTAVDQPAVVPAGGENGSAPEPGPVSVTISNITLDEEGRYVIGYETAGLPEKMTDRHLHFFFDSVPAEEAGAPASGAWLRYYGPAPFNGYTAADRPQNAGRLCAQVTNADHTPVEGTADCAPLPDVVTVSAAEGQTLDCLSGPGEEFAVAGQLPAGESALVEGLAPNELWWSVVMPGHAEGRCWLPTTVTTYTGDISQLPLVDATSGSQHSGPLPMVGIEGIGIDQEGRYSVVFAVANFEPEYPGGTHMHFFWNTFSPDDVGIGGEANRLSHGELTPFTGFRAADRPPTATEMCVVVANPDHSVIPNSGHCWALPDVPSVAITGIQIDDQGHYAVDFQIEHFQPSYPGGTHLHFFWNVYTEDQVGIGGEANRLSYGDASPFTGFVAAERPPEATQLCAVVAAPDHRVIPSSGSCFQLPDVAPAEG